MLCLVGGCTQAVANGYIGRDHLYLPLASPRSRICRQQCICLRHTCFIKLIRMTSVGELNAKSS